jgi:hypothetical protein
MPADRLLSDERITLTILTAKPADPLNPKIAELNAVSAINASCLVYADDFTWTATDSERVGERALCETSTSESPGVGAYDLSFTAWRYFDTATLAVDVTADKLFQAVKVKGTRIYPYVRRGGKKYDAIWAVGDEFQLGGEVLTDTPQSPDNGGFIKYKIPLLAQRMKDFGTISA